jgi:hypothetical protein
MVRGGWPQSATHQPNAEGEEYQYGEEEEEEEAAPESQ